MAHEYKIHQEKDSLQIQNATNQTSHFKMSGKMKVKSIVTAKTNF